MALTKLAGPPPELRPLLRVVWPVVGLGALGAMVPVTVAGAFHSFFDRRARLFRVAVLTQTVLWLDLSMFVGCWRIARQIPDRDSEEWRRAHEQLFAETLDAAVGAAGRWVGFKVELAGRMEFGAADAPLLAFARHAGPGDSLALAWLLSRTAGRLPRIVLADALRWDPSVDTILTRLQAYFVAPGVKDRVGGVAALAESLHTNDVLLIFPEGQNWSEERRIGVIESFRRRGLGPKAWRAAFLRHVLPPRAGGVVAAMTARPDADVMIIGHAGLERVTSLRSLWRAIPFTGRPMLVHTDTHAAASLPSDPASIERWLEEHWSEMDEWISDHSPDPEVRAESGWIKLDP